MIVKDASFERVIKGLGGGGRWGRGRGLEESCDLLQKLHFLNFNHKFTNISPAFKYVY